MSNSLSPETVSVVILAAGLGTRMKSKQAKVLHRAGGLTLVEQVVRAAREVASPENIVTVVGHQAQRVRDAVASHGVRFAEQTEQRGTGHALLMCREMLANTPGYLVILYGDCPLLKASTVAELVRRQRASQAAATVITTHVADPQGYGRIVRDAAGKNVTAIVEQKACTPEQNAITEINSGIYCFRASELWTRIAAITPNAASGEIYLTDMVEALAAAGLATEPMIADEEELLGINTRLELAVANRILRARKTTELMLDGVTIDRPETVSVDLDVRIGRDTIIEPGVQILGATEIGEDCRIGTGSIIRDSRIADGVDIDAYTLIGTSRVGAGAKVGPFARLRLDNDVEAGAHIGNFVELKKTKMGAKAKANHLAYLGDASIGGGSNIGAGTITCNYDGTHKHQTRISANSFIGSNATLVAPVEIGEGSYVAAGSVITYSIAEDTLAFGRARQVVKPGWPSKRKGQAAKASK
ncbi:MAG: UDP-N-acetylglucosamine diphosphorylase/glucosamine-1-phosphate N-acetyltransferase [Acidobacteria bacterium]|nr:UDP-N-acetylglucosamine diphosphorylase/glucosamine-1-phosphate N-acetyltransferase [Acidobacteriota bacterium]